VVIVVRAPRLKLLFLFVLDVIMVAASACLAIFHFVPPVTELVGWAGILFFGLCGGWILSRFFSHRISLVLDRDGLVENSSALPTGRIAWEQITRIGITAVHNQRFLGIDVRDRALLPSSTSKFRRWIDDQNLGITGFPVNIPSTTIDRTLEELHDLIAKYWKEPKARTELGTFDPRARPA